MRIAHRQLEPFNSKLLHMFDLVMLSNFSLTKLFFKISVLCLITESKFRINIDSNLTITMMPQPHNYKFANYRLEIMEFLRDRSAGE